jgi:hypothetical protein
VGGHWLFFVMLALLIAATGPRTLWKLTRTTTSLAYKQGYFLFLVTLPQVGFLYSLIIQVCDVYSITLSFDTMDALSLISTHFRILSRQKKLIIMYCQHDNGFSLVLANFNLLQHIMQQCPSKYLSAYSLYRSSRSSFYFPVQPFQAILLRKQPDGFMNFFTVLRWTFFCKMIDPTFQYRRQQT